MPESKKLPRPSTFQKAQDVRLRTRQIYLTIIILLLAFWIALPFLTAIAWAVVLAIAQWPLYRRAIRRFPQHRTLIAFGFTIATALLVVVPLSLAAVTLAQESQGALNWLQHAQQNGIAVPPWLAGLPLVGKRASFWWQQHVSSPQAANALLSTLSATSVLGWTRSIGAEVAKDSALFFITLVVLVTLLVRGDQIASRGQTLSGKMFGTFGETFFAKMTSAVRATVNGTILVSVVEGVVIGFGYVVTGVPQPLLFGVLTVILAFVPFGAWLVFGLASLILIGSGSMIAGGALFAFGVITMTVGDNVIQPSVIGNTVQLPFLMAMIGVFGGIAALGLVGLFVGPVIMAALLLVLTEWLASPDASLDGLVN